ncbi:MAG: hypothetical protein FJX84_04555 [Bacteroidetes bacterium]|nr:hypothetical protein [Bacteroidota bacterium]
MTNNSVLLKKFSIPILFLILGLVMLIFGIKEKQNLIFNISSLLLLGSAVLSLLYSWGGLSRKIFILTGVIAGILSLALLFLSWQSVADTQNYNSNYKLSKSLAISNLNDLRTIQMEYLKTNKKYASTIEELKEFLKTATTDSVATQGTVPSRKITVAERDFLYNDNRAIDNNMTLIEAYRLSKSTNCPADLKDFKYDTLRTSLLGAKFTWNKSYKESRAKSGFYKFNVDSLFVIPFTGGKEKWKFEVATVKKGKDDVPVMRISGNIPFAAVQGKKNELLFVGKLDVPEATPIGSWEDE